jgi:drug/metabolite transporter (DMT)-like permease
MIKRIIQRAGITWAAAATLGLLYGACAIDRASIKTLWETGVVQMSLIFSTSAALLITPLAVWALKPPNSMKKVFGLWLLLVAYILLVTPWSARWGLYGALLLCAAGLVSIRLFAHPNPSN